MKNWLSFRPLIDRDGIGATLRNVNYGVNLIEQTILEPSMNKATRADVGVFKMACLVFFGR